MATERRASRLAAVVPALVMLAAPASVHAASSWWQPLAFIGQRVSAVTATPGRLTVTTGSMTQVSTDGGRTFHLPGPPSVPAAPGSTGATLWEIRGGVVYTGAAEPTVPDPGAPFLGAGASLIAAPAALEGVAVAVGTDNHVWRRAPTGRWATSFILLPAGGVSGVPRVTALAAFTRPLSGAVYMGTAGYGVLLSEDGGDDWIRADPGLPADVLGLAADASTRAVYAATDGGLYVHHLQAFPAPPVYQDASLYLRWLGMGLVGLVATMAAVFGLRRALPVS